MYVCMDVCVCIMYVGMYVCMCIRYVCMDVGVCIMYARMHVCMYVCICVLCMYVCMYVCMCVYVCLYVCMYVCTYVYVGMYLCNKNQQNAQFFTNVFNLIIVSSTCFEHPSFHPQEDLYLQLYGISFMHPYKHETNTIKLQVQNFLRMFETC